MPCFLAWSIVDLVPPPSPLYNAITRDELLSGKLLPTENEYKEIAEQNLLTLKSQQEKSNKHLLALEYVVGYMSSISFLVLIIIALLCELRAGWRIGLILFGLVNFVVGVHFCLKIEKEAEFYECGHCQHKYIPTYKSVFWSMHYGRTRYMKCPKCNKRISSKKHSRTECFYISISSFCFVNLFLTE